MREFLAAAVEIEQKIKQMEQQVEEMRQCLRLKQCSIMRSREEEAEFEERIERMNESIKSLGEETREKIRKNQEETKRLERRGEEKGYLSVRELRTTGHAKDLSRVLQQYRNLQSEYSQREKERLRESFVIAKPDATEDELEALEDREKGDALLASVFALGSHSAQHVLLQAKRRKKRIDEIVATVNSLVTLIEEIDKMVKKQTPQVDQITVNMSTAEVHTSEANRQLWSALSYQRATKWFKRIIFLIIFVVCVFLAVFAGRFILGLLLKFRRGEGGEA